MLLEYCQKQKRPLPKYKEAKCDEPDQFRSRLILPDPKVSSKDILLMPNESFSTLAVTQLTFLISSRTNPSHLLGG
jgi:hypothetical protein